MKILNERELNTSPLRNKALAIAEAGLSAIDPARVIMNSVTFQNNTVQICGKTFPLEKNSKIIVIGIGKCAINAAYEVEKILGNHITSGIVLDVRDNKICKFKNIECIVGSHPLPTDQNITATKKIINILSGLSEEDLVIYVISGGGSTLLCQPVSGGSCSHESQILTRLFEASAPIQEINIVRKHLSLARGGYLAQYAYPAHVVSLLFSDVPGNDPGSIASGPTIMDPTTIEDAKAVLKNYKIPSTVELEHHGMVETPKDDKYFKNVFNCIVTSNQHALDLMAKEAKKLGLSPSIQSTEIVGEARVIGKKIALEIATAPAGSAYLYGGETTVAIIGHGRGGRNQEVSLGSIGNISPDTLVLSLASDGKDDGPHAGAIADQVIQTEAKKLKLNPEEYLENNNSSAFFEKAGGLLETGDTGSNVSDLIIAIKNINS